MKIQATLEKTYKLVCMQNRRYSTGISRNPEKKKTNKFAVQVDNIKVFKARHNTTKIVPSFLKISLRQTAKRKGRRRKEYIRRITCSEFLRINLKISLYCADKGGKLLQGKCANFCRPARQSEFSNFVMTFCGLRGSCPAKSCLRAESR